MGIELSLDPPRQEGRLARMGRGDQTPIPAPSPGRLRACDDFASIFEGHLAIAPVPQPESLDMRPVAPPDAPLTASDDSIADPEALTDWIETDITAGHDTATDAQITDAAPGDAGAVAPEPEIAIAAVPLPLRAAQTTDARITAADAPALLHRAQGAAMHNPQPQYPALAPAARPGVMDLPTPTGAKPDVPSTKAAPNQGAITPIPGSVANLGPEIPAQTAILLPPTASRSVPQPLPSTTATAVAARFSAALTDGTQTPETPKQPPVPPQIHLPQPIAKSEVAAPMPERMSRIGPPQSRATQEHEPFAAMTKTIAQPMVEPPPATPAPFAPLQTESGRARTGERRLVSHVGTQLLHAATTSGPNTELQLNPVELGRVRLNLQAIDSTITVTIMAERPETADLMRRHVDTLAQEFRALGYQDVNVSVGQRQAGPGQGSAPDAQQIDSAPNAAPVTDEPLPQSSRNRSGLSVSGGLDLRL